MRSHARHRAPEDTAGMLMTRPPVTAAADDYLVDAAARMAQRGIRHLPIVDGDRHVVGMLSDRDLRTVVGMSSSNFSADEATARLRSVRVSDVMTRDVLVVGRDAPFSKIALIFIDQRVGAVPVIDEQERIVGIISYVDVFKNAGAL